MRFRNGSSLLCLEETRARRSRVLHILRERKQNICRHSLLQASKERELHSKTQSGGTVCPGLRLCALPRNGQLTINRTGSHYDLHDHWMGAARRGSAERGCHGAWLSHDGLATGYVRPATAPIVSADLWPGLDRLAGSASTGHHHARPARANRHSGNARRGFAGRLCGGA